MATYYDDEPIPLMMMNPNVKKGVPTTVVFDVGLVKVTTMHQSDATNMESKMFPVLVELLGVGLVNQRMGADIVVAVDVSASMADKNKLPKLKRALVFLIRKLGPNDRLSIIQFSSTAQRLCNLRRMTPTTKAHLEHLVQCLRPHTNTNTTLGLQLALQVLAHRRFKTGRSEAILLMSDGVQNEGENAASLPFGDVPIHTFGYGSGYDYNPMALQAIAKNSKNGTFSYAEVHGSETCDLSSVFSQVFAGLLRTIVQDLRVTISPGEDTLPQKMKTKTKIDEVFAGDYKQTTNNDGSITISFGNLYLHEKRRILVFLTLPAVNINRDVDTKILLIRQKYNVMGDSNNSVKPCQYPPGVVTVNRTQNPVSPLPVPVLAEMARNHVYKCIKDAFYNAEKNKFDVSMPVLKEAKAYLNKIGLNDRQAIEALNTELDQLLNYMQNNHMYTMKGRPFVACSMISHERQRLVARGDDTKKIRCFATPCMDAILVQAAHYEHNPNNAVEAF